MFPFFLKCCGNAYKSGKIQGEECKDIIIDFTKNLNKLPFLQLKSKNFLAKFIVNIELLISHFRYKSLVEKRLNYQAEKIRGISDGSGQDMKTLYMLNANEIFNSMFNYNTYSIIIGVEPSRMEERQVVICRNYNYYKEIEESQIVRFIEPEKRFKTLSFNLAPLSGTLTGINEHSLSIFYNFTYTSGKKSGLTASMVIQEILERCKSIEEAIGFLKASDIGEPGNFIFADKDRIVGVELAMSDLEILYPENGILIMTNHFNSQKMRKYNNIKYPSISFIKMSEKGSLIDSQKRYEKIKNLFGDNGKICLDDLKFGINKHINSGITEGKTNKNGVCNLLTRTVLIVPSSKQLLVLLDNNEYASYSL